MKMYMYIYIYICIHIYLYKYIYTDISDHVLMRCCSCAHVIMRLVRMLMCHASCQCTHAFMRCFDCATLSQRPEL